MVNPLSVLTPGVIRKILFEGGFENPIPKESRSQETPLEKTVPAESR
jgi:hypothetical protein